MGTLNLRFSDELINDAKVIGDLMGRSAAKQVEHWAKIGKIMEENPDLTYEFVRQALIAQAEINSDQVVEYQFD